MSKQYGIRSELKDFPFPNLEESLEIEGVLIEINKGVLDVSYDNESERDKAEKLARSYIYAWSLENNIKISIHFNHSWHPQAGGGTFHSIELSEKVKVIDRVITHSADIQGKARIIRQDSASFANHTNLVLKSMKDEALSSALEYFSEEVIDTEKPLYGIYKALEAISKHLGILHNTNGRKKLAEIAGTSLDYVNDVMETTQLQRHHSSGTSASRKLDDNECKTRAKFLIDSYAKTL